MWIPAVLHLLASFMTPDSPPNISDRLVRDCLGPYRGCFVLREVGGETLIRYKPNRCAERKSPCSTFKVFSSLAGLDCGALSGPDELIRWNGKPQPIKSWERDHTLRSAIENSVVWYYQEVARRIGPRRMQSYLDRVGYGNRDISGGIDRFWLGGSLLISADEQVAFLEQLYLDELPFDRKAQAEVRRLLVQESGDGWTFSGKTGSRWEDGRYVLGWFVGHVRSADRQYVFVMDIDGGDNPDGRKARRLVREILFRSEILPTCVDAH